MDFSIWKKALQIGYIPLQVIVAISKKNEMNMDMDIALPYLLILGYQPWACWWLYCLSEPARGMWTILKEQMPWQGTIGGLVKTTSSCLLLFCVSKTRSVPALHIHTYWSHSREIPPLGCGIPSELLLTERDSLGILVQTACTRGEE